MVKVKKRDGKIEDFRLSEIVAECEEAGSTPYQTACVIMEVANQVKDTAVVDSEELKDRVVKELRKVNKAAATAYEDARTYRRLEHQ